MRNTMYIESIESISRCPQCGSEKIKACIVSDYPKEGTLNEWAIDCDACDKHELNRED